MSEGFYSRKTGDRWGEILENWEEGAEETALDQARALIIDLDQEAASRVRTDNGAVIERLETEREALREQLAEHLALNERLCTEVSELREQLAAAQARAHRAALGLKRWMGHPGSGSEEERAAYDAICTALAALDAPTDTEALRADRERVRREEREHLAGWFGRPHRFNVIYNGAEVANIITQGAPPTKESD